MPTLTTSHESVALEIYDLLMSKINPNLTNANYQGYMQKVRLLSADEQIKIMAKIQSSYQIYQKSLAELEKEYSGYLNSYEKKLNQKIETKQKEEEKKELDQLNQNLTNS